MFKTLSNNLVETRTQRTQQETSHYIHKNHPNHWTPFGSLRVIAEGLNQGYGLTNGGDTLPQDHSLSKYLSHNGFNSRSMRTKVENSWLDDMQVLKLTLNGSL